MAERALQKGDDNHSAYWSGLTGTDTGEVMDTPAGVLAGSVQLVDEGSFSGTIHLEGTLDGTNWEILKDTAGAAISMTAEGLSSFAAIVSKIRPRAASVTGAAAVYIKIRA